jgi:hypothetical protein
VIGHLGTRVSALLDGQLTGAEEERAWAHVHACHRCRDLVESEGWVKTRLIGLSFGPQPAPTTLKGSLLADSRPPADHDVLAGMASARLRGIALFAHPPRSSWIGLVALGGGAAVIGLLALTGPSSSPPARDRRPQAPAGILVPTLSPTGDPDVANGRERVTEKSDRPGPLRRAPVRMSW